MRIDLSQLFDDPVVLPQPDRVKPREARLLVDPVRLGKIGQFPLRFSFHIKTDLNLSQKFKICEMRMVKYARFEMSNGLIVKNLYKLVQMV